MVVPSFEDAIIAVLFNHNIQSRVIRYQFPVEASSPIPELLHYVGMVSPRLIERADRDPSGALAEASRGLRPELDLFKVTDVTFGSVSASDTRCFRRVFHRQEDSLDLHLSSLKGVRERYETPFFEALVECSHKPTGVLHALPVSRGTSISKTHWIQDMGRLYGRNIFLAETSSTTGGLDSLLQPTGPIKDAQRKSGLPGRLPAERLHHVRRGDAQGDQASAVPAQGRRKAAPGAHAAADQLHVRRRGLRTRAHHARGAGHQTRHDLPLGRGLIRVRLRHAHLVSRV